MTQMVLNIEDISLVASLKEILSAIRGVTIDRLIESEEEVAAEKRFIKNSIERGFMQAKEGKFAGKNLTSLDSLVEELRAEIV
ncbi:MAG: hypothetical protein K5685_14030 [Bacteroidales bacterium]|nr:hypothetical protein [Bacteroidales bacterium]